MVIDSNNFMEYCKDANNMDGNPVNEVNINYLLSSFIWAIQIPSGIQLAGKLSSKPRKTLAEAQQPEWTYKPFLSQLQSEDDENHQRVENVYEELLPVIKDSNLDLYKSKESVKISHIW